MSWFSCSIGGNDISAYVKSFTRDGSICEVAFGLAMDLDTRAPTIQPAQSVTMDIDGVRWFTGYVNSSAIQRSAGTWVNRVVCDHYSLKRLRDYFWVGHPLSIINNFVDHVIDLCFDSAGAVGKSIFDYDISEVEMPPYEWSTGTSAFDVVMDCCLFGMLQMNPYPDGTVHFQKMQPVPNYVDLTNRTVAHERRIDDAYFRTDSLVLGWATESALVSGSSPYGYKRTMVVANPHLISSSWTWKVAQQLLDEYNELATIEKNTIPTRERINLGDSTLYTSDRYTKVGIVTRNSSSASESGFLQTLTTGEKCPKIFGFEKMQPTVYPRLIVHNHKHVLICDNFFDVGQPASWRDITPSGVEIICSLSIDEDDHGAWLVSIPDGGGANDPNANGVFRASSIQDGGWGLVLSQANAKIMGKAKKAEVGWTRLDYGEMRSCVSFGNGLACVPEVAWEGFSDRDPTVFFTSANGGGSWLVSILPIGFAIGWDRFWCSQYNEYGCHQIDWDGSSLYVAGTHWYKTGPAWYQWTQVGAVAVGNGTDWAVVNQSATYTGLRSCRVIGSIYSKEEYEQKLLVLPATSFGPYIGYDFGFTPFEWEGAFCHIAYPTTVRTNTSLYVGEALTFTSGGIVATVSVANGGSGYSVGNILTLAAPDAGTSATVQVAEVSGTGVKTVVVLTGGAGYSTGVKNTGGGGGCTINVLTLTDYTRPFGAARMYGASEFVFIAKDTCSDDIATYWLSGTRYDRTGNFTSAIGVNWEGTVSETNNYRDSSAIEAIATSDTV